MSRQDEQSSSYASHPQAQEQQSTFDSIMGSAVILSVLSLIAYFALSYGIHNHIKWLWLSVQKVLKYV